ncbi:hypothetical protein LIA77_06949 [Sarocladium implicatum]|nr:hypothetical protein LIA77_06949 [Sarocladium implicatum]
MGQEGHALVMEAPEHLCRFRVVYEIRKSRGSTKTTLYSSKPSCAQEMIPRPKVSRAVAKKQRRHLPTRGSQASL